LACVSGRIAIRSSFPSVEWTRHVGVTTSHGRRPAGGPGRSSSSPSTPTRLRLTRLQHEHLIGQSVTHPLVQVTRRLGTLPPLVHAGEVDTLRRQLAEAARGERFLLQGGDCAELFDYCNSDDIEAKIRLLVQMSLVLTHQQGARMPVVRVLRGAGQYAKPRSSGTESWNGQDIVSYRGDNVNGYAPEDRSPNPDRLLQYPPFSVGRHLTPCACLTEPISTRRPR